MTRFINVYGWGIICRRDKQKEQFEYTKEPCGIPDVIADGKMKVIDVVKAVNKWFTGDNWKMINRRYGIDSWQYCDTLEQVKKQGGDYHLLVSENGLFDIKEDGTLELITEKSKALKVIDFS